MVLNWRIMRWMYLCYGGKDWNIWIHSIQINILINFKQIGDDFLIPDSHEERLGLFQHQHPFFTLGLGLVG
jgi:hypothetical protein